MKLLFTFTLLFVYLVTETTLQSLGVVHPKVIEYVLVIDFLILFFQILLLLIVFSFKRNKFFLISISIVSTINVLALKLSYYKFFLQLDDFLQLLIGVLLLGFIYKIYSLSQTSKNIFYGSLLIISSLIAVLFFQSNSASIFSSGGQSSKWNGPHKELANKLINSNFIERPNIHIIGFDALTPEKLVRKFFDESETLPYVETVMENNGQIFPNSFAMTVPTSRSWASFLMLDQELFDIKHNRFNGEQNSILFNLFRNNGYSIMTGYAGSYLGVDKGKFVDIYDNFAEESGVMDSVYCLLSDTSQNNTVAYFIEKHFDLCDSDLFKPIYDIYFSQVRKPLFAKGQELHLTYDLQMKFQDKAIRNIMNLETSTNPWISIHHFATIGHVGSNFKTYNQDDIDHYYQGSYKPKMKIVSEVIEEILEVLNDDSILLIVGDHGTYISTSIVRFSDISSNEEKEFYVQDRHGIFTAIFNEPTNCNSNSKLYAPYYTFTDNGQNTSSIVDDNLVSNGFTSPARVLAGVIRCLSDEPEELDKAFRFKNNMNFQNYLYDKQ